ncbi:MAG: S8 family serine peptidase [Hyphomicrobiales bacterium]
MRSRLMFPFLLVAALLVAACGDAVSQNANGGIALVDARTLDAPETVIISVPLTETSQTRAYAEALIDRHGGALVTAWPLASVDLFCLVLAVPAGTSAESYISSLADDPQIVTVSRVNRFQTMAVPPQYTDELYGAQHGLRALNAQASHAHTRGNGVRVAVIDTAVSPAHPDLAARVEMSRDFVGTVGARRPKGEAHGTAVAAVIAADGENGTGIVGVAPEATILGLRACWETDAGGRCNSFSLARAMNVAIAQGADVINMSLSGQYDPLLDALITRAAENGAVMIAARGTAGRTGFPASHSDVLSAHVHGDAASRRSIALPGRDILSARPASDYDFFSGDSIAAAHLSGVAALIRSSQPDIDQPTLNSALTQASRQSSEDVVLDSCKALSMASAVRCR